MIRSPNKVRQVSLVRPTGFLSAVTRVQNKIIDWWQVETVTYESVNPWAIEFAEKVQNFRVACDNILEQENIQIQDRDDFLLWYQEKNDPIKTFEMQLKKWLKENAPEKVNPVGGTQNDDLKSLGRKSIASCSSVTSQARIALAEKRAKLRAEQELEGQRQEFEKLQLEQAKQQQEHQLHLEQLKRKIDLKQKQRETDFLEEEIESIENGDVFQLSNKPLLTDPAQQFCMDKNNFLPKNSVLAGRETKKQSVSGEIKSFNLGSDAVNLQFAQLLSEQNKITTTLMQNQENSFLPRHEPPIFDGKDVTKFKSFLNAFEAMIESRCRNDADRYYYLEKYTVDEPQLLVQSCNQIGAASAYVPAMNLLKKHYGNAFAIAQAYIERLHNWPAIKSEDGKGLKKFSLFLLVCQGSLMSSVYANPLDSPCEIAKLMMKLPFELRRSYRRRFAEAVNNGNLSFSHFVNFVSEESEILNIAVAGDIRDRQAEVKPKFVDNSGRAMATNARSMNEENRLACIVCKKDNHNLESCFFFVKKPQSEKLDFLKSKGMCYACLQSGHMANVCTNRLTCAKCKGKHPTCLHLDKPDVTPRVMTATRNEEASASGSFDSSVLDEGAKKNCATALNCKSECITSGRILHAAVPVRLKKKDGSGYISTYMGLDNFSSDFFIDHELMQLLGYEGKRTSFKLTTMNQSDCRVDSCLLENLEVCSLDNGIRRVVPKVFSQKIWPFARKDSPKRDDLDSCEHLKELPFELIDAKIGLLAGISMPEFLWTYEVVYGKRNEAFATKHLFGWAISGPIVQDSQSKKSCHHINLKTNEDIEKSFRALYAQEFNDSSCTERMPSFEDKQWLQIVQRSIYKNDTGHYVIELPFKQEKTFLPSNYTQVLGRLLSLKKRFLKDPEFFAEYNSFINEMLNKGFLEAVPKNEVFDREAGSLWYLTHFAVYHKQKRKIRVVFDCSLKNAGISLNDCLLQGPDLTNSLIGVLLRFRENRIAFSADIEKMFFQVKVPEKHADFLRILWFPGGDLNVSPVPYRITSHVFGAVSSPSCANFALKQTGKDGMDMFTEEARNIIESGFYVDDCIKSVTSEGEAVSLIAEVTEMVSLGGFNLTGFVSNSRRVLESIPKEKLGKNYMEVNFEEDDLPNERALGVQWKVEDDKFSFKIKTPELQAYTRRSMLSLIASVFDPLGIAGPIIVAGRLLFQNTCRLRLSWDDQLTQDIALEWMNWVKDLPKLEEYSVDRCLRKQGINENFSMDSRVELHLFSDGSEKAYGTVAYARFVGKNKEVVCSLVCSKSHLTPIGNSALKTIPRIELNGARMAVQLAQTLKRELTLQFDEVIYWTDSRIVLYYLRNDTARFQRFVANRVSFIRSHTDATQWRYIPGELNPADLVSRGLNMDAFLENKMWKGGPDFLWKSRDMWPPVIDEVLENSIDNLEIVNKKKALITACNVLDPVGVLLHSSSNWYKILYRVATFQRMQKFFRTGIFVGGNFTNDEVNKAEWAICKYLQDGSFADQKNRIANSQQLRRGDSLRKLAPLLDQGGLLRVGGRIGAANENYAVCHPIILPRNHQLVEHLVRHFHRGNHMGLQYLVSLVREKYWIVGVRSLVKSILRDCIICQKVNSRPSIQVMAPLPASRITSGGAPFSNTGVDYFGPFMVARGRGSEKRYGVVFSCMTTRAVHLEVACSLETSSFIDALRRFMARRGKVELLQSDNGTNLVGACRELKEALNQLNDGRLSLWCQQKGIEWNFHPPSASHFGGLWEREIRSIRKILNSMILERPHRLTDESLRTLMCEAESILNNRPLTYLSDDPRDMRPLTPNNILLLQSESPGPPGEFEGNESQYRQRWKKVQALAEEFWKRWRKEYLLLLQERQKWTKVQRSHTVGDLVLVVDYLLPRNQWCLGLISQVFSDDDGHVRKVKVRISRCKSGKNLDIASTEIDRPITKLILVKAAVDSK